MKILMLIPALVATLVGPPGPGVPPAKPLSVVATTPDLAAVAREIGGDLVTVTALAKPTEDPHFVDAKPSHLVTLNRADVLIEGGAELELGWLPPLLDNARNDRIAAGAPGRIVASQGIKMLEVPATFDRSKGDVHSLGNPHFLLDPVNAKIIAEDIANHLAQVSPAGAETFKANLKRFDAAVDRKMVEWQKLLEPYRGARIVTYHKDFVYLGARFNLDIVENLEPRPGIAPSPAHLAQVVTAMRSARARVILVQPYQNRKTAETVARQVNGIVLDAPQQPGAVPNTETWFTMMDHLVKTIATGLAEAK
jgi:zinc/manganese transport system substrate-binding protein